MNSSQTAVRASWKQDRHNKNKTWATIDKKPSKRNYRSGNNYFVITKWIKDFLMIANWIKGITGNKPNL